MGYKNIHLIGGNVKQGNWDAIPTALSDDANELRLADQRLLQRWAVFCAWLLIERSLHPTPDSWRA